MKLKTFAAQISKLAAQYPNADVVYSRDDEGNGFEKVHYAPSPGSFDGSEFFPKGQEDFEKEKLKVNAVCIN